MNGNFRVVPRWPDCCTVFPEKTYTPIDALMMMV